MSGRIGAVLLAGAALVASGAGAANAGTVADTASGRPLMRTAGGDAASGRPIVRTTGGLVQGKTVGRTREFLGIPYAAPPVGALRWRPPAPAPHWRGVRQATAFAPHCAQAETPFGSASTSEDCLYLNVYAPARPRPGRLPVMVWIHGGALVAGSSDGFDPTALAARGAIVVTINYRLGALGFLASSGLADRPGGPSGNYGLMDQQAALRWVASDIGRFGGDARGVTVFGESAGGLSVLSHLVSPGSRGLVRRAIVQSGTYNVALPTKAAAEAEGKAFAASVGCPDQNASCLRAVPVATVLAKQNRLEYVPDIDGRVIPEPLTTAFAAGRFARVPVAIGTTHDEWRLQLALRLLLGAPPVTAANYQWWITSALNVPAQTAATIAAHYPLSAYPSPALALTTVVTDARYSCTTLATEKILAKYVPVRGYEFADENAPQRFLPPVGYPYGAAHASELQYLFGLAAPIPGTLTPDQQKLADAMKTDWTAFAAGRLPQSRWPAFRPGTQRILSLVPPAPRPSTGFAADHRCAFWSSLP
ncbi:carboxylesterase/lipase family protein [Actinomadura gamaensis]|uniref:Carboxylic ester hydrolase n=1 Tax=Actinomadura gamaensis TaxID=1763541 RepID=A0ABV9TRA1_9ACTN